MHLSDMLLRTRAAAVSIVMAVFGGAAVALEKFPQNLVLLAGVDIHISAVVMFFGLLLLFSIFVLDYFYYYRMLIAVVERTEELEAASRRPDEPIEFFLTGAISGRITRRRAAAVLWVFYGVPFLIGVVFLLLSTLPVPAP
jgi:hypothetical protein